MAEDRFTYRAAVYLILEREGRFLLSCRLNTGYGDGKFNLPAGHADGHESMKQAAIREGLEELGIVIEENNLQLVHISHRNYGGSQEHGEVFDFFFHTTSWRGEVHNMEPHKCSALKWCTLEELPPNTMPYIKDTLWAFMTNENLEMKTYNLANCLESDGR